MSLLTHRQALSVAAGGSFHDALLALSPWGYWKLDENPPSSGGVATDSSGNARHGTYSADTFTTAAGLFGSSPRCPVFVGTNTQAVNLPNFGHSGKFSLLCFFASTATSLGQIFTGDSGGGARTWQCRLDGGVGGSSKLDFVGITNAGSAITVISPGGYNDGNPHMVACMYDASLGASGAYKLYADGVLVGSSASALTAGTGPVATRLGCRGSGSSDGWFSGNISNAALFTQAITAAQIADLWAKRNDG